MAGPAPAPPGGTPGHPASRPPGTSATAATGERSSPKSTIAAVVVGLATSPGSARTCMEGGTAALQVEEELGGWRTPLGARNLAPRSATDVTGRFDNFVSVL